MAPAVGANSNITVNAGGVGLWIAVTACIVVMAVTVVGAIFVAFALSDLNRQTQELRMTDQTHQAYINTLTQEPPK